jgi:hypothetical protein
VQEKFEEFSCDFLILKVHYEEMKACDDEIFVVFRFLCYILGSYFGIDAMRLATTWRLYVTMV